MLVIFDCDGVLVDSEYLCSELFSKLLTNHGYAITTEESIRRFTGVSDAAAREIIKQEADLELPADYWSAQLPTLFGLFEKQLQGLMQPVLHWLASHNIQRCVASNSSKSHVLHCLEVTKQIHYFDCESVFSAQQVPRGKPAPDLFLHAAKAHGVAPKDCIVVEDSPTGIQAAQAAGMRVIGFSAGRHASFDWYREKLANYSIPIATSTGELIDQLLKA